MVMDNVKGKVQPDGRILHP